MAAGILAGCQWELNSFLTALLIKIHVLVIFLEGPSILFIGIFFGQGFHHDQAFKATTPAARGFARSFPA